MIGHGSGVLRSCRCFWSRWPSKLLDWGFRLDYTEAFGLPAAPLLLAGSVVVELGAGLALAAGYR